MALRQVLLAAVAALGLCGPAMADQTVSLMTSPAGGSGDLVFGHDMEAPDAFTVRLTGIVAPGSRVTLSIDRDARTLLDGIVRPDDCDFGREPPVCELWIPGGAPEFATLVHAFRAGLVAHLEIANPGFEPMRSDTSLVGFATAFDAL